MQIKYAGYDTHHIFVCPDLLNLYGNNENIIIETKLDERKTKVIGFENHGGITHHVHAPFGRALFGNWDFSKNHYEGFFKTNVIATYLHGPLLAKNPKVADYIIQYCINRKSSKHIVQPKIDDSLEIQCRQNLFHRMLKNKKRKFIFKSFSSFIYFLCRTIYIIY